MPGTGEKKLQKRNTSFLYVSDVDLFDVIHTIHVATGHGARDVMNARVKKKYANVTKEVFCWRIFHILQKLGSKSPKIKNKLRTIPAS